MSSEILYYREKKKSLTRRKSGKREAASKILSYDLHENIRFKDFF